MRKPETFNEAQVMQRIQAQDQTALAELYEHSSRAVYAVALRVLGHAEMAEDVLQDVFLKVWNNAHQWDPERGKLISWLLTITRYTAIDRLRREQRRPPQSSLPLEDALDFISSENRVGDQAWRNQWVLSNLLGRLPGEQAEVIEHAYYKGMSHTEIAAHLNLPLGTVKTRLRLGMQKLRTLWFEQTTTETETESDVS